MMWWLWGGGLFLVAAAAIWWSLSDPKFVAGLIGQAARALWKALAPAILKRKPAAEEEIWHDAIREGMAGTDQRRGKGPSSK